MASEPHLPSLSIEGFRGIRSLDLPRLGRVTLLAGENGVGKTTVLDAFRFYAARGDSRVLLDLLDTREEFIVGVDEDGDSVMFPNFASLFHNPDGIRGPDPIRIRAESSSFNLSVRLVDPDDDERIVDVDFLEDEEPKVLKVFIGRRSRTVNAGPMLYYDRTGRRLPIRGTRRVRQRKPPSQPWPAPIQYESLGPGLLDNVDLARLWDAVTLTDGEELAIEALRLVIGKDIVRLNVIGDNTRSFRFRGRRAVAKLRSHPVPVPIKRLGDGANRLLAIALALANSRNGILLIDEAENGIHYSVQSDLWRMVFRAAEEANVQVIAATHSWDCIAGFAEAAIESEAHGTMFRLERFDGELQAVLYSEENLGVATRQRTEVR